jgi:IMP dehydrogenase
MKDKAFFIRCSARDEPDYERIHALAEAGVDVIVLDSRNGDNNVQLEMLKFIKVYYYILIISGSSIKNLLVLKNTYPAVEVIAGNVVRASQARLLLESGADGLRVGIGVGSGD